MCLGKVRPLTEQAFGEPRIKKAVRPLLPGGGERRGECNLPLRHCRTEQKQINVSGMICKVVPALLGRARLVRMSVGLWLKPSPYNIVPHLLSPGLLVQGSKWTCLMTATALCAGWRARSQPGQSMLQAGQGGLQLQTDGSDLLSSPIERKCLPIHGSHSCPFSTGRFRNRITFSFN